jgi:hypothetical protein
MWVLYLRIVKVKAMIMMVCLLAYLAGWTAVPRMMRAPEQGAVDCCAKMDKTNAHQCPKDGKQEKGCADCCLNCPMCYTMILPGFTGQGNPSIVVTSSFGELPVAYLYQYYADVWRPPNAA